MAYTTAKIESFCYECNEKVKIGEVIFLSKYLDKVSGLYKNAWKHAGCVSEIELRKNKLKRFEFLCKNCFLYKNVSQLADEGENICSDC